MTTPDQTPEGPGTLAAVVREIEQHASYAGWEQPALLFALVDTAELLEREPQLAAVLGLDEGPAPVPGSLTPVEQETVSDSLEDLLPTILWPAEVAGCAVVVEATTVPPGAAGASEAPLDPEQAAAYAAEHPDREEARIVAAALRTGESFCAIRQRSHDEDDLVLTGPDLVPGLVELLLATLRPEDDAVVLGEEPDELDDSGPHAGPHAGPGSDR
ncbi:PPA1309 family protein [Nocardioides korecus]